MQCNIYRPRQLGELDHHIICRQRQTTTRSALESHVYRSHLMCMQTTGLHRDSAKLVEAKANFLRVTRRTAANLL
jgi:hypothetical protein